jgi:hypothetical protein
MAIEALIENVSDLLDALNGVPGGGRPDLPAAALLTVSLSFVFLFIPLRAVSAIATVAMVAAAGLLSIGADRLMVAVLLLGVAALVTSIEALFMRRRLNAISQHMKFLLEDVRQLQISQERQQTFQTRPSPSALGLLADQKLAPAPRMQQKKAGKIDTRNSTHENGAKAPQM